MKRSGLYRVLASLITLGIFNLIFWLIFDISDMFTERWIAYGLIHASFLMILVAPLLTKKHPDGHVGGMLLSNISRVYFAIQLLLGVIILCVPVSGEVWLKITVGVQGVLLLVYLCLVLFVMFSSTSYAEAHDKHEAHRTAKLSVGTLKRIHALCADDELKENIQLLIDKASATPVTAAIASQFDASATKLERAVRAKDKEKSVASINELLSLLG